VDNLRPLKRGSTENKPSERQKNAKVRLGVPVAGRFDTRELRSDPIVTPQRTRNDRIAASDRAKQSVGDPDHRKLTDLVLEMAAERLSLEADAVVLGQNCPLFCRNEPVAPLANQFEGNCPQRPKKGINGPLESRLLGLIAASIVLPREPT
jgi:hypothetical protein